MGNCNNLIMMSLPRAQVNPVEGESFSPYMVRSIDSVLIGENQRSLHDSVVSDVILRDNLASNVQKPKIVKIFGSIIPMILRNAFRYSVVLIVDDCPLVRKIMAKGKAHAHSIIVPAPDII